MGWGLTERIELEPTDEGLEIDFDPEWLRPRMKWREGKKYDWIKHLEDVFLYLQSDTFADIRSEGFRWIGGRENDHGPVKISFPGGEEVVIEKGTEATATITFRKKSTQRIRIVDTKGAPLSSINVDAFMFWSHSNHCGGLGGAEPKGKYVSDENGTFELLKEDVEYALEFDFGHEHYIHRIVEADGEIPMAWRVLTSFPKRETVIVVYEFEVRSLVMQVHRNGKPVPDLTLGGQLANCRCMGCPVKIGITDENGRIEKNDFRPEEFDFVVLDEGEEEVEVWRAYSKSFQDMERIEIDLPPIVEKPKGDSESQTEIQPSPP